MKNKILLTLGILLSIVLFIVALAFWMTGGITRTAEAFLVLLNTGNTEEAYRKYLSQGFKENTSYDEFETLIQKSGLSDFEKAYWYSRSIRNDQGELEGEIRNKSGQTIPLKIILVEETEEWKILSIYFLEGGILSSPGEPDMPPDTQLKRMASEAILSLGSAINKNDFTDFHKSVSMFWKTQTNPDELRTAFLEFNVQNIDLTSIQGTDPVFNKPPHVNENGILKLDGYFTGQPLNVFFGLSYVYEHPNWKLMGINVSVNPLQ